MDYFLSSLMVLAQKNFFIFYSAAASPWSPVCYVFNTNNTYNSIITELRTITQTSRSAPICSNYCDKAFLTCSASITPAVNGVVNVTHYSYSVLPIQARSRNSSSGEFCDISSGCLSFFSPKFAYNNETNLKNAMKIQCDSSEP
jgi:hypothetical protein